jgi:hypothetical protein
MSVDAVAELVGTVAPLLIEHGDSHDHGHAHEH